VPPRTGATLIDRQQNKERPTPYGKQQRAKGKPQTANRKRQTANGKRQTAIRTQRKTTTQNSQKKPPARQKTLII
jgi:hypothetical protein